MTSFINRLQDWRRTAADKLKKRGWRLWLLVVGSGYVVLEVVRAWISDAGTLLLIWLFRGLQWLAQQPMGVGGLLVLGSLLFLVFVTWWEARPRPDPPTAEPEPIPEPERRLIQDVRVVWNRHGRLAVPQLCRLFRDAMEQLDGRCFWSSLLQPIVRDLERRTGELDEALKPDSALGIQEVRHRFNAMYEAYIGLMRWTAQLQAENLFDAGGRTDARLKVWRQNHRDMHERLRDLSEDPEHRGTMKIFLRWIENPAFRDFLRDAETSPAWLKLMKEEEVRTAPPVGDPSTTDLQTGS